MRHTIRIERRSTTQDASGEPVYSWSTVLERKASLERLPGPEIWASAGRNQRVPTIFRARFSQTIFDAAQDDDIRLVFNGRFYDIISIVSDAVDSEMIITTSEHVEEVS